jgi:hypothetical protein
MTPATLAAFSSSQDSGGSTMSSIFAARLHFRQRSASAWAVFASKPSSTSFQLLRLAGSMKIGWKRLTWLKPSSRPMCGSVSQSGSSVSSMSPSPPS